MTVKSFVTDAGIRGWWAARLSSTLPVVASATTTPERGPIPAVDGIAAVAAVAPAPTPQSTASAPVRERVHRRAEDRIARGRYRAGGARGTVRRGRRSSVRRGQRATVRAGGRAREPDPVQHHASEALQPDGADRGPAQRRRRRSVAGCRRRPARFAGRAVAQIRAARLTGGPNQSPARGTASPLAIPARNRGKSGCSAARTCSVSSASIISCGRGPASITASPIVLITRTPPDGDVAGERAELRGYVLQPLGAELLAHLGEADDVGEADRDRAGAGELALLDLLAVDLGGVELVDGVGPDQRSDGVARGTRRPARPPSPAASPARARCRPRGSGRHRAR